MSRRHSADKREVLPDPKFGDILITKFMNVLMYDGKKSAAEAIIYGALDKIQRLPRAAMRLKSSRQRLKKFVRILKFVRAASVVPPIRFRLKFARIAASLWRCAGLSTAARARSEHTMMDRLAGELVAAVESTTALRLRSAKTRIVWRKRTKPSPISVGKDISIYVSSNPYRKVS